MTLWTIRADSPGVTAHSRTLCKAIQDRRAVSSVYSEFLQPSQSRLQTWGHLFWTTTCFDSFHRFETEPAEYCTQNHRPVRISSPLISRQHHQGLSQDCLSCFQPSVSSGILWWSEHAGLRSHSDWLDCGHQYTEVLPVAATKAQRDMLLLLLLLLLLLSRFSRVQLCATP